MDFIIALIIRNITMLLLKFYFWDFAQTYFYLILLASYKRISPVRSIEFVKLAFSFSPEDDVVTLMVVDYFL